MALIRLTIWPSKLQGASTGHSARGTPVAAIQLAQRDAICNRRAEGQGYMREGLQPRATLRRLASFSRLLGGGIPFDRADKLFRHRPSVARCIQKNVWITPECYQLDMLGQIEVCH